MKALVPDLSWASIDIPDATPGLVSLYSVSDEQALLATLRYNRLVDLFTGLTCYSLQSNLKTPVPGLGQVDVDEMYIGIDRRGAHYALPTYARDRLGRLDLEGVERNVTFCAVKFPNLICRPIAAQFMADDLIALFEFEETDTGVAKSSEKHYQLVAPEEMSAEDLDAYMRRGS